MVVEGFMNITDANLYANRFGGSRRFDLVFESILAYLLRKPSGAHVGSVAPAKPTNRGLYILLQSRKQREPQCHSR